MSAPGIVVGTGPSELHAMIDLEYRAELRVPRGRRPHVTIMCVAERYGEWSVVGEMAPSPRI